MNEIGKVEETEKVLLSEVEETTFDELRLNLQSSSLKPIIWFFIVANSVLVFAILGFAIFEHLNPIGDGSKNIITDKVMIAAVAGIAFQSGAVLIAAFRGLFSG